jgi:hypothetical protein
VSNDNDKTLQLELTINETNLILEALGQQPFKLVYELIHKIQRQAQEQLGGQEINQK